VEHSYAAVNEAGQCAKWIHSSGKHPVTHRYATHRWESCSI